VDRRYAMAEAGSWAGTVLVYVIPYCALVVE
jgi:hypothetical protein